MGGAEVRQTVHDVFDPGDQLSPLLDEAVGAGRPGIERRPRYCVHLPMLLDGVAGSNERARPECGLDHHDAQRQAGDDAVALGKMLGERHHAGHLLADQFPGKTR